MRHVRGCEEIEGGRDAEPRDRLAGRFGALDSAADDPPVRGIGADRPLPETSPTRCWKPGCTSQPPFEFRTLSEEITNQGRDLVSRFIQCEMSRFQDMDFGLSHLYVTPEPASQIAISPRFCQV